MVRWVSIITAILIILLAATLGLAWWLVGTDAGTRWLVGESQKHVPGSLQTGEIRGNLLSALQLKDVRYRNGATRLRIAELELAWRWEELLRKTLHVEHLRVTGLDLEMPETRTSEASGDEGPTAMPQIRVPVDLLIEQVELEDLQVRSGESPPFVLDRSSTAIQVRNNVLTEIRLDASGPLFTLTLSGNAALQSPHTMRFATSWSAKLPEGLQLAGRGEVEGNVERLEISHRLAKPFDLTLAGHLSDLLDNPGWQLELNWTDLEWPPGDRPKLVRSPEGGVHSEGSLEDYRLSANLRYLGPQVPAGNWRLEAAGGQNQIDLESLRGHTLQGTVTGRGRLSWQSALSGDLRVELEELNLLEVWPGWPAGHSLTGNLAARIQGDRIWLDDLRLSIPQNALGLQGRGSLFLAQGQEPDIELKLDWSGARWPLAGDAPMVLSESGGLELSGTAEDYQLEIDARLHGAQIPRAELRLAANGGQDRIELQRLQADLLEGVVTGTGGLRWAPELAGSVDLAGRHLVLSELLEEWDRELGLEASLAARIDGDRFELVPSVVSVPATGMEIRLSAEGLTQNAAGLPEFTAKAHWQALRWPLSGPVPLIASHAGEMDLSGTSEDYRLKIDTSLSGEHLPAGAWRGSGTGDTRGFELAGLRGDILGGSLTLEGTLGWQPYPKWNLRLNGENLDPGRHWPELPGRLALAALLDGEVDGASQLSGSVVVERLRGRLRDLPLEARADARIQGERYRLDRLDLRVGANRAQASGALEGEALSAVWSLDMPDLAALLPGAGGKLTSQGDLGGSLRAPRIKADLQGASLIYQDAQLERLSAKLNLGLEADQKLAVRIEAGALTQETRALLDSLVLAADGSLGRHTLTLDGNTGERALSLEVGGSANLQTMRWEGAVERLASASGPFGNWRLEQAAKLRLGAEEASLERACLRREKTSARVCTALDWAVARGVELKSTIESLSLALAHPDVTGKLDGSLEARLHPDGALRSHALVSISPGVIKVRTEDEVRDLPHRGGEVRLDVTETGLDASAALDLLANSGLTAALRLPELTRLPPDPGQRLDGWAKASLPDLDLVSTFAPQVTDTKGILRLDTALSGTLEQPQITGIVELKDASARIPDAGLDLRPIGLRLVSDPQRPDVWRIEGGLRSGAGAMKITGDADPLQGQARLQIKGENFQAVSIPDVTAVIAPDLQLDLGGGAVKLRGELHIPEAAVTPNISISDTFMGSVTASEDEPGQAVRPSRDVVFINDPQQEAKAQAAIADTLAIDSQVDIILGDKVEVDVAGFRSRFAGAVRLTNKPRDPDLIPMARGELRIVDGSLRSFGQDLDIERGRITFDNVPATEPELDIRGVRQIRNDDRVRLVGTHITGTPQRLQLQLFSEPMLEQKAILSYFLTGRASDSEERALSVGAYVRPDLYVSYARDMLKDLNSYNIRYDVTRTYDVKGSFAETNGSLTFTRHDVTRTYGIEGSFGEADNSLTFTYTLDR